MIIWVDADACPRAAKELVYAAAQRFNVEARLVANTQMNHPKNGHVSLVVVGKAFNEADDYIADNVSAGDLVITADIPLADRIVDAGATGLDPRGTIFNEENIKSKLAMRNLLADLREGGMVGGGPPPYGHKDRHKFLTALDRHLTKALS